MKTYYYRIRSGFARRNNLLIYFVASPIIETEKAVYLYGHGTVHSAKTGTCCRCGRTLTHPVSVELGIGPECGGHYHNWDLVGGYTMENLERLRGALIEIKIDSWIPKSQITGQTESEETVDIPKDHPMLEKKPAETKSPRWAGLEVKEDRVYIKILFPYNTEDLERVRSLPNRKYDPVGKSWSTPFHLETIARLREWGFHLGNNLLKREERMKHPPEVKPVEISGLKKTMFPFQKKGVEFIESRGGNALIADEMGLGKTVQAIAWLHSHPEMRPAIIVVPASAKFVWAGEFHKWVDNPKFQILSGTTPDPLSLTQAPIIIVNYDILQPWLDSLIQIKPKLLVADECHYFKNNSAKRTKAIKKLRKNCNKFIALSGTPIENRPFEFFNVWHLLDPVGCPNFWEFVMRYCAAHNNGFGWDFSGASNILELHERLKYIMIRRKKAEVLTELPQKVRTYVPLELENKEEYQLAESDFVIYLQKTAGVSTESNPSTLVNTLAQIEKLKQIAVRGKLKQVITWIKDFLEVDGKLVVFAHHKFTIDALMEEFQSIAVKLDGSVPPENRQKIVSEFQNNEKIRLFVGNIKAAGVAITLTTASHVAFIELPWTPGELTQAEDRCHRIGQVDNVTVHYLLAIDTIEEKIAKLLDEKRIILDSVLDGKITEEESLLTKLIKKYE